MEIKLARVYVDAPVHTGNRKYVHQIPTTLGSGDNLRQHPDVESLHWDTEKQAVVLKSTHMEEKVFVPTENVASMVEWVKPKPKPKPAPPPEPPTVKKSLSRVLPEALAPKKRRRKVVAEDE